MVTDEARGTLASWLQDHMIVGTAFTFLEAAAFRHPSLRWLDEGRPRVIPRVGCEPIELPGLSLPAQEVPPLILRVLCSDATAYRRQTPVHLLVLDFAGAHQTRELVLRGTPHAPRALSVDLDSHGAATLTLQDLPPGTWQVTWQDDEASSVQLAPCRFTIADDPADAMAAEVDSCSPPLSHPPLPRHGSHVLTSLGRHDVLGGLEPGRGGRMVRGLHLSHGPAVHHWPVELERIDTTRARLRITRDIEAACVVVIDPLPRPCQATEPCRLFHDLLPDQVVEFEVPSPAGLLLVGASVAGLPFEGAALTLGPQSMACRVALPRDPHAGEPLDVVIHARGTSASEAVAHVVVKDVRLGSGPSPLAQLAAALHSFAASHGFRTRAPRRPYHAAPLHGRRTTPAEMEEFLVAQGLLTVRQKERVQDEARRHHADFVATALHLELFSEQELGRVLASAMEVPYFDLDHESVDPEVTPCLDRDRACQLAAVPVMRQGDRLCVALLAPDDAPVVREVAAATGLEIVPLLATGPALHRALHRLYGSSELHCAPGSTPYPPPEALSPNGSPLHAAPAPREAPHAVPPRTLHAGLVPLGGGLGRVSLVLPPELATYRVEAFVFCDSDWCEASLTFSATR